MKKIVLSIVLFFGIVNFLNAQIVADTTGNVEVEDTKAELTISLNWQSSFEDAVKKAKKEKKPILIYFTGSDWCGPCIRLEKDLFATNKFKKISDNKLVLYKADFPRNTDLVAPENRKINKELSHRYAQTSFPTMIIINEKGEVLGRKNGSYMTEYYFPFFEETTKNYK